MPSFDLICLANARKMNARCVAGIRVDTGEWIRPVSRLRHGELNDAHRRLSNDGEPENFDVIRVGVSQRRPAPNQPENWLIDGRPWKLLSRPAPVEAASVLQRCLLQDPMLFGSKSDRAAAAAFEAKPAAESLVLVRPRNLRWYVSSPLASPKKARVRFQLEDASYDLVITDPPFETRLKNLGPGPHASGEIGVADERVLFTISLGEPLEGYCYKLVAAVLEWPSGWPAIL
jgi:hypothetical protein